MGPIGIIKNGDIVEIDIDERKMNVLISDEEIEKRVSEFSWKFEEGDYPRYLNLFVKNVGSMAKGGIWE